VTAAADLDMDRQVASDPASRQARALEIFTESGAVLSGHFVYTSGRHGDRYLEKFRVLERAEYTEPLCRMIAAVYAGTGVEVVAAPTTGGIILAYEVGRLLDARGIFCEREGDRRVFRRGFEIGRGQKVLVVDDVVTTGGSLQETFAAVEDLGGVIAGVGVLADRSGGEVRVPYPYFMCLQLALESWAPEDCPLCRAGDVPEAHRGSQA